MKYNSKDDSAYTTRINQLIAVTTNSDSNILGSNGRMISPDNMTESTSTKKSKKGKKSKKMAELKGKEAGEDEDNDFEITDNVLLPKVKNNK